jgi:glutaredoxin
MVTIYTFTECPYCQELKKLYEQENINYREVDITLDENQEEWNKVFEASKAEEVPVIKIGQQLFLPNISFKSITESVELTKKFLT